MTTNATNTDQQVAQSETLEQIATKVVNQIAVGAWQYCSRQWVIGLVTEALRNERERAAKLLEKRRDQYALVAGVEADVTRIVCTQLAEAIRGGR